LIFEERFTVTNKETSLLENKMVDYDLKRALVRVTDLAEGADSTDLESMFDSLAEIALTTQNALADHAVTALLRTEETYV
jgi:hypothetical protein